MKGSVVGKKTASEAPIGASNGAEAAINGAAHSLAPSVQKKEEEEKEETPLDVSKGPAEEQNDVATKVQGPKLGGNYYVVEAIRSKRVHEGRLQYLIKWKGWPEKASTWEPLKNLRRVRDFIDAFEKSLKPAQPRQCKRRQVVQQTQIKNRVQRSTTTYSLRSLAPAVADNHAEPPLLNLTDPNTPHTVIFADVENGVDHVSKKNFEKNEEPAGYDPKFSELKENTINVNDADKVEMNSLEDKTLIGNDQCKEDSGEAGHSSRRGGAKRRKPGSVKRFEKDCHTGEPADAQNVLSTKHVAIDTLASTENNSYEKLHDALTDCDIVKIIKPLSYLDASNGNNILVTFLALRSDGANVIVDNKYLKLKNPIMLVNFYEEHLRYTPTQTPTGTP